MNEKFPDLSFSLFKYGPVANVERTLTDKTLGFSHLNDFNDIYENEYLLDNFCKSVEDSERLLNTNPNNVNAYARRKINETLSNFRISCLSRRANIPLMWSHYSGNHEGVCYCFAAKNPKDIFRDKTLGWGGVVYSSQLPTLSIFQEHTKRNMLEAVASKVILTKPIEWAYEEEMRFWGTSPFPAIGYDPSALRAIIVGRRTSDEQIENIRSLILGFNQRNGSSAELWFAHRYASSFMLGICNDLDFRNSSEIENMDRFPILPRGDESALTE